MEGSLPVGWPANRERLAVKIHSAAFAVNPRSAGELAALYLSNPGSLREAEVMDLDEEAHRSGVFAPMLCGYLRIPFAS
jgi:predicted polyphosphate/ATP-dependent NAD kinase